MERCVDPFSWKFRNVPFFVILILTNTTYKNRKTMNKKIWDVLIKAIIAALSALLGAGTTAALM